MPDAGGACVAVALIACVLVAIDSPIVTAVSEVINRTLTSKMSSDSGVERSAWNMQSLINFVDTFGLGPAWAARGHRASSR